MFLAVDIGGTKTLLAAFSDSGKLEKQAKFSTPDNFQEFLSAFESNFGGLGESKFKSACVAIPGVVDRTTGYGIRFGNLSWHKVPIQSELEKLIGCPVLVENDAKAGGYYEAKNVSHDFINVLFITIGTGIGISHIMNGAIDYDYNDRGGNQVDVVVNGRGIGWEKLASGRAIVERFGKKAADITDGAVWKELARDFAIGIETFVQRSSPDIVIIGGGVGSHFDRFGEFLGKELQQLVPSNLMPEVRMANRPEEAVIYGCFELAKAQHDKTHN